MIGARILAEKESYGNAPCDKTSGQKPQLSEMSELFSGVLQIQIIQTITVQWSFCPSVS